MSRSFYQYDHPKPYQARVYRGGSFATAEEVLAAGTIMHKKTRLYRSVVY